MDLDLPNLDIKEPDELDLPTAEDIEEDIEQAEEDNDPFIKQPTKELMMKNAEEQEPPAKPPKKKRELSEKQLAHLARMREKATAKREAKKKEKEEALSAINEKHKAKSYKPEQHKKRVQKEYKKRTIPVKDEVEQPPEPEEQTPEDFLPSHKAKEKKKKEDAVHNEQMAFINFMTNMERYKQLKGAYNDAKERQTKKTAPSAKPVVKKQVAEPVNLVVKQDNPYNDYFG